MPSSKDYCKDKQHNLYTVGTKKVLQILAIIITFIIILMIIISNFILGTRILCEIYVFCILSKIL